MSAEPASEQIRSSIRAVGIRPTARALGHGNPMRVQKWVNAGRVPVREWAKLNAVLVDNGVESIPDSVFAEAFREIST